MKKVTVLGKLFNYKTFSHEGKQLSKGIGGGAYAIYRSLEALGIEVSTDPLWKNPDKNQLAWIKYQLDKSNDRQVIVESGGSIDWTIRAQSSELSDILIIKASLYNDLEYNKRVEKIVKQGKIIVYESSVSTSGKDSLFEMIGPKVDIFIPSYIEAKTLFNTDDINEILDRLERQDFLITGLKLGGRGSCLIVDGKRYFFFPFDVQQRDATGAGDLFISGIVYAFIKRMGDINMGVFASALGALGVSQLGINTTFSVNEVIDFIAKTKKKL